MSLPSQLQNCVASGVIVADSILGEACNHLEFLGYKVEQETDCVFVSEPARFSWMLKDFRGGVMFRKSFPASEGGRERPEALLALSNRMNTDAGLLRTYVDAQGDLAIEAWFPNLYERRSFGRFVMALETELRELLSRCRAEVSAVLS